MPTGTRQTARSLNQDYNAVLRTLVGMAKNAATWTLKAPKPAN